MKIIHRDLKLENILLDGDGNDTSVALTYCGLDCRHLINTSCVGCQATSKLLILG